MNTKIYDANDQGKHNNNKKVEKKKEERRRTYFLEVIKPTSRRKMQKININKKY
jgi:hypothetical protein